ncbi:MAG: class I mannose-6-phosphate isomerase [Treponema sp.]|jgi:mannose-6-phosphate isomerase|nr:class I mannose-6-phosphate isomerase [Treponema sp.]
MVAELSAMPLMTDFNRVERFYSGGNLLDKWQGIDERADGFMSEEFLVSTTEYIGTGNPPEKGISRVIVPETGKKNLHVLINGNKKMFLGNRYEASCHGHTGVQLRVGDSASRLIIQCHPNDEQAKKFFKIPFGKTEAWYMVDTRAINGEKAHVYCGFKPGITREKWVKLFENQDSQAMLESLHRFEVKPGDCFLIKAGTPHAIGSGCLFIELHQPCDVTLRMERNYTPQLLTDEEMHYGAGFETLFDCFEYIGRDREETFAAVCMKPREKNQTEGGELCALIKYEDTNAFSMKKLILNGICSLPPFEGHYLLAVVKGKVMLEYETGSLTVSQGRGVFVPAGCRAISASGKAELIIAYPYQQTKDQEYK